METTWPENAVQSQRWVSGLPNLSWNPESITWSNRWVNWKLTEKALQKMHPPWLQAFTSFSYSLAFWWFFNSKSHVTQFFSVKLFNYSSLLLSTRDLIHTANRRVNLSVMKGIIQKTFQSVNQVINNAIIIISTWLDF